MSYFMSLFDGVAVSVFGSVLSAAFCDAFGTRRKHFLFCLYMVAVLGVQGLVCSVWSVDFLLFIYPLVTHIPLMIYLYLVTKKALWSVVSVFLAYLCCQLRRWISLFVVAFISDEPVWHDLVQVIITVPLLLLLLRFVAPTVRKLSKQAVKLQLQFAVIPALYYVFDYVSVIYTDFLASGSPVIIEFMPFVCCCGYLVFLLYYSIEEQKRFQLQQTQKMLDIQISQSTREISTLLESQELNRRYRHDLRHHLQYISACIENEKHKQAKSYIADICRDIEAQKLKRYCENEAVNLILSAFVGRAKKIGVDMNIHGTLSLAVEISDNDLCVLLSNVLENALNACEKLVAKDIDCTIDIRFYEKDGRFFLQVTNPCSDDVCFEKGLPVSNEPEHGIGVSSICAIVEKYGGLHTFLSDDGLFVVRISL